MRSASTGQIKQHSEQLTQSSGNASQGSGPAIRKQAVGHA
jgi:hypothetical protein